MSVDYRQLIESLHDGVYFTDNDRCITCWNKAAEAITGFAAAEVIGHRCADNILQHVDDAGNQLCLDRCPLAGTIQDGRTREAEVYLHHKAGHRVRVLVRTTALRDDQGQTIGGAELFTDLSAWEAIRLKAQEMEQLAFLDALTGLSNRRHIESELNRILKEKQRYGGAFGVLFMDIDHFKQFNDAYGHDMGDRLLKIVAQTLQAAVRPFDTMGRWGGEEFVGVIRNVDAATLLKVAERCRNLIARSVITINGQNRHVTVSLGATQALADDTPEALIKRADALMYASKKAGRNRVTQNGQ